MAEDTAIEWADDTANFWEGCTQVSPACDFCYAMARAKRYGTVEWNGPPRRVKAGATTLRRSNARAKAEGRRRLVFINSISDTFDNRAPEDWRREMFDAIKAAPHITALILTKRIGNAIPMSINAGGFPRNAALGATFCNQDEIERDGDKLAAAGALLHVPTFASIEPMLGPILLTHKLLVTLGAVIVGGESGPEARPMHPDWVRALRDQCVRKCVPFHFKQWGEWIGGEVFSVGDSLGHTLCADGEEHGGKPTHWWDGDCAAGTISVRVGKKAAGRVLDGRTHDEFLVISRDVFGVSA